jgi:hypothetical protein
MKVIQRESMIVRKTEERLTTSWSNLFVTIEPLRMMNFCMYILLVGQCPLQLSGIGTNASTFSNFACRNKIPPSVDYRPLGVYITITSVLVSANGTLPNWRGRMWHGGRWSGRIRWTFWRCITLYSISLYDKVLYCLSSSLNRTRYTWRHMWLVIKYWSKTLQADIP